MIFGTSHVDHANTGRLSRRWLLAMAAGSLSFILAGCTSGGSGSGSGGSGGAGGRVTLTGKVVDANNNDEPIAGAKVTIDGNLVLTGTNGTFSFSLAPISIPTTAKVEGPMNAQNQIPFYDNGYHCPPGSACSLLNLRTSGFLVGVTPGGSTRNLGIIKLGSTDGPPFPPGF